MTATRHTVTYSVLATLAVLSALGGAWWQGIVLFGGIALGVHLTELRRWWKGRRHE